MSELQIYILENIMYLTPRSGSRKYLKSLRDCFVLLKEKKTTQNPSITYAMHTISINMCNIHLHTRIYYNVCAVCTTLYVVNCDRVCLILILALCGIFFPSLVNSNIFILVFRGEWSCGKMRF